jgi:hypothetical protein
MTNLSGTNWNCAGRGLKPRPERFDVANIFEPYEKPCGRGSIPRPALANESSQDIKQEESA